MKSYVKPDLYYEDFELSHNVASCSDKDGDIKESANLNDGNSCVYDVFGVKLFTGNNCQIDYKTGYEGYCYQTSTDGMTFFHS